LDPEDDPVENDDGVLSPPPDAGISGPESVDERLRDLWSKYMVDHKNKNLGTDSDSTHFALWAAVGDV
jgi:hypothetical protein